MTGNEEDAEDVVQETFLRAYRQLRNFEQRANFSTWLYRIATNCAVDTIRARKRRDGQHHKDGGEVLDGLASQAPDPARLLAASEVSTHVNAAMGQLSSGERTAFVLRHFEGLPIDEIGRILNLRTSATKHTIFRAVKKLRQSLEPLVRGAS